MSDQKTNKDKLRVYNFTFRLGWYSTDKSYLVSYEHVVKMLFNRIDQQKDKVDMVAAPLLFLMRHSMELGYKINIKFLARYGEVLNEQEIKFLNTKHYLDKLHVLFVKKFNKSAEQLGLTQDIMQSFKEYENKTRSAMELFSKLDNGSYSFRYETDTDGNKVFPRETTVNLLELKEPYEAAMTLLKYTDAVLQPATDYVDMMNEEMEYEMRRIYADEMRSMSSNTF